ncbi:pentapeptide repeat-containing protein [Streptomyces sp. NPDC017056]|uniref:pentapeptide repeat-containing protein n=1 Tax=Streptomyces sp. NPDC017056 TaxID=3364973 RepID=UPI0037A34777
MVNVLAAYVRTHHPTPGNGGGRPCDAGARAGQDRGPAERHRTRPLPEDIHTALTVISDHPLRNLPREHVDLRGIDFRRADLRALNFRGTDLGRVFWISPDQPAPSGAVHRKAEHCPRTGCPWVMRQRREVPCQTARARDDPKDTP